VIIRALQILKSKHRRDVHVVFTGGLTERRKILDKLAERLGVSSQIHFLGFVPTKEIQVIFRSALSMVFPSKFEGFGLPILEAFQAKLPVLSSQATTLPEVGQDAPLYFDPDSAEELSSLMLRILNSPQLRRQMIERGTQVLTHFSMNRTVAMMKQLYWDTAAWQHSMAHTAREPGGENQAE
jgi:glycosyltransferase involved in cell wall biosynthesis